MSRDDAVFRVLMSLDPITQEVLPSMLAPDEAKVRTITQHPLVVLCPVLSLLCCRGVHSHTRLVLLTVLQMTAQESLYRTSSTHSTLASVMNSPIARKPQTIVLSSDNLDTTAQLQAEHSLHKYVYFHCQLLRYICSHGCVLHDR